MSDSVNFNLSISIAQRDALDTYQHTCRIKTRSEAIRALLLSGLRAQALLGGREGDAAREALKEWDREPDPSPAR